MKSLELQNILSMKKIMLLFAVAIFLSCCEDKVDSTEQPQDEGTNEQIVQEIAESKESIELEVIVDNVRIRDAAGLKGKEVTRLAKKSKVIFNGEFSDFTDKIKLRGIQYDDPWLKISTAKGAEGWIYGGSVKFDANEAEKELYSQLITKRMTKFFGTKAVFEIEQYQKSYKAAKTEREFALVYRSGKKLLDKLNEEFIEFFEVENFDSDYPDLFWIDDPIPAMTLGLVAEGTMYQLFTNIEDLNKKAVATKGSLDDDFTEILKDYYDGDIAYYFPVFYLQTWDYGGYSLLGQGKHKAILNRLEKLAIQGNLFTPEIKKLKSRLLEDITSGEEYGEKPETILKELDEIINKKYSIITAAETMTLKNRRPMFEDSEKYEIQLFMKDF
ncbi:MAG: hypothetical protein ACI97N_001206 [Cognaticolwellia sp.]|jgi:hypothetical protein